MEKNLIIGRPGTGKTHLGNVLADLMDYNLVDEVPSARWLSLNGEPRTVYVSSSITYAEACKLSGFTVIAMTSL